MFNDMRALLAELKTSVVLALLATLLVVATATPAMAFVPPGQGASSNFGCGPANHPGAVGQFRAMEYSGESAAWNAHFNSSQITNC